MLKRYPYFKTPPPCLDGTPAPEPLSFAVKRVVRFEEIDMMGILWHGRYPSYLEDARVAFGAHYGIGYTALMEAQIPAPVKQMYVEYITPLKFGQICIITTTLHWSEAARMNYAYTLCNENGVRHADAYTVQLFTTLKGELLLEQPKFYHDFCLKWKAGDYEGNYD